MTYPQVVTCKLSSGFDFVIISALRYLFSTTVDLFLLQQSTVNLLQILSIYFQFALLSSPLITVQQ